MEEVPNVEATTPAPADTEAATEETLLTVTPEGEGTAPEGTNAPEQGAETGGDEPLLTPGEGGKEETPKEEGAPEAYSDYEVPEGFSFDEETKAEVDGIFRGLNLSQKQAQQLVDAYAKRVVALKEAEIDALNDRRKQWRAEVRQRPTFAADRAFALKGINAVVTTPEEREMFTDSWMSDHPVVFGMFAKIGRLLGEDTPLPIGSGDSASAENINAIRFPVK